MLSLHALSLHALSLHVLSLHVLSLHLLLAVGAEAQTTTMAHRCIQLSALAQIELLAPVLSSTAGSSRSLKNWNPQRAKDCSCQDWCMWSTCFEQTRWGAVPKCECQKCDFCHPPPPPRPPPRPPLPPPLPARPPRPPLFPGHCVSTYGNCLWSRCCSNPQDACYKKRDSDYFAQCRPLEPDGACISDRTWTCPSRWLGSPPPPPSPPHTPAPPPPLPCAGDYAPCQSIGCCASKGFSCDKKFNRDFAMCRPYATSHQCTHRGGNCWCKNPAATGWVCQESWMARIPPRPSPPPSPLPSPPPPPPFPPPRPPCVQPYGSCWAGRVGVRIGPLEPVPMHCCNPAQDGSAFVCRRRSGGRQYAQCRAASDDCNADESWDCAPPPPPFDSPPPSWPPWPQHPLPPLPPPTPCSENYAECLLTHPPQATPQAGSEGAYTCCKPFNKCTGWHPQTGACTTVTFNTSRPFGCFQREGRRFAQCRPLPTAGGECVSDAGWVCPESPPPLPPTPPPRPSLPPMPPYPPLPPHGPLELIPLNQSIGSSIGGSIGGSTDKTVLVICATIGAFSLLALPLFVVGMRAWRPRKTKGSLRLKDSSMPPDETLGGMQQPATVLSAVVRRVIKRGAARLSSAARGGDEQGADDEDGRDTAAEVELPVARGRQHHRLCNGGTSTTLTADANELAETLD